MRGACAGRAGGFGCGRGEVEVVAEGVVDAGGGRGTEGGGGLGGGLGGGDDAERLGGVVLVGLLVVLVVVREGTDHVCGWLGAW